MRPVDAAFTMLKQSTSPEEIEKQRGRPVQTTPPQNIPQGQPQFQQTCPTCGGTGIMQGQ